MESQQVQKAPAKPTHLLPQGGGKGKPKEAEPAEDPPPPPAVTSLISPPRTAEGGREREERGRREALTWHDGVEAALLLLRPLPALGLLLEADEGGARVGDAAVGRFQLLLLLLLPRVGGPLHRAPAGACALLPARGGTRLARAARPMRRFFVGHLGDGRVGGA